MHHPLLARTAVFMFAISLATVSAADRRFTVEDSIELSTFVYPLGVSAPRISHSPDKAHFVVVTMRGDATGGKREATMWLISRTDVFDYLHSKVVAEFNKAVRIAKFASASNREPIRQWRWSTDSKSILFLGADDDGAERLYRIDVAGGKIQPLSRSDQDVSRYDERNGTVVYLAHAPIRAQDLYQAGGATLPDTEVGTGENVMYLLFPNKRDAELNIADEELWRVQAGNATAVVGGTAKTAVRLKDSRLVLSEDGKWAVVTSFVKRIPKSWERYQPLIDYAALRIVADTPVSAGTTGTFRPRRFDMIDLAAGESTTLLDSPIEFTGMFDGRPLARWNADGSRIALMSAYPPLGSDAAVAGGAPVPPCEVGVFTPKTRTFECVRYSPVIDPQKFSYRRHKQMISMEWRAHDRELVAQYIVPSDPEKKLTTVFTQHHGTWTANDEPAVEESLAVTVREEIDQRPTLVARLQGGAERTLLDPNPQLAQIALGSVTLYHWKDPDGDDWEGGLVLPPDFSRNRRYPLVIQTHGLDKTQFLVDGPSATGYAARALAARDIVVLQVGEINKRSYSPQESEAGAAGYRAAVKQLAEDGIVDAAKVGIIAWSHFGPHTLQGLVDEPRGYAAATWAEAAYNSYGEYLMNIDYQGGTAREQALRAQLGAKPFGAGLREVVSTAAAFHTDRVCTPILFQFNDPLSLIYSWDGYAALRAQNKPVELFYIRNGQHELVKPRERLIEQGMNVDWYDYWLNGRKDPDPRKAGQYERWDSLKSQPRCGDEGDSLPKEQ